MGLIEELKGEACMRSASFVMCSFACVMFRLLVEYCSFSILFSPS